MKKQAKLVMLHPGTRPRGYWCIEDLRGYFMRSEDGRFKPRGTAFDNKEAAITAATRHEIELINL